LAGTSLPLVPPVLGNLPAGPAKPIAVGGQSDHFNGTEPFGGVGRWVAERYQLTYPHQHLNVVFGEAKELRGRGCVETRRESPIRPGDQGCLKHRVKFVFRHVSRKLGLALGRVFSFNPGFAGIGKPPLILLDSSERNPPTAANLEGRNLA
jgi:hypothetical protein